MVKSVFKFLLAAVVYSFIFIIANALLPFSQGFKELGSFGDSKALLFLLFNSAWVCFTLFFIIKNTEYSGKKLFLNLLFISFFIQCFMTQIETLFFGNAFTVLTKPDVVLLMLAGLLPLLGTIPLLILFFQNKNGVYEKHTVDIKKIIVKLGIIGVIYLCVYFAFGYFVAWQFEELRIFYSGSAEKLSFFGQLANNIKANPVIFPFQILRGILFGCFVIPLIHMVTKSKLAFISSVCLAYLCTAIVLLIPNVLFPDMVRIGHFIEMASSMLLFGIITGNIFWEDTKKINNFKGCLKNQ